MIQKVEMYTVVCDNCGEDAGAIYEYSCWNDENYAEEVAMNQEWIREEEKHFCPRCYSYDDTCTLLVDESRTKI